ncbi:MAG: serine/threonine-protein phosphatase, partial [Bacteroidaceae bacterium]|nr:serine/threonine-protein phosphatase [Bacteroidaceae bacterium]
MAQNIQMSMLPKTYPPYPERNDIEIYGSLTPAKGVGGDLYDFFIRDEKLFFCIGDVSGKGVPASLVMAVTRTLFRNIATHNVEPSHIVETMNMNICEGNDNNMFVTMFVGVLDLATGHLCYCNAGHDAPYIQTAQLPCNPNLPVGVMSEWKFTEQETTLNSNTMIFLYTDGLTEA